VTQRIVQWVRNNEARIWILSIANEDLFLGVGTTYAMVGAYILAGELSKMESNTPEEIVAALRRYEEVHRSKVGDDLNPPPGFPQLANPQTQLGVFVLNTVLRVAYWSMIPKLFQKLGFELGGEGASEKSKLPEYGW
jgi:hypothetical protein